MAQQVIRKCSGVKDSHTRHGIPADRRHRVVPSQSTPLSRRIPIQCLTRRHRVRSYCNINRYAMPGPADHRTPVAVCDGSPSRHMFAFAFALLPALRGGVDSVPMLRSCTVRSISCLCRSSEVMPSYRERTGCRIANTAANVTSWQCDDPGQAELGTSDRERIAGRSSVRQLGACHAAHMRHLHDVVGAHECLPRVRCGSRSAQVSPLECKRGPIASLAAPSQARRHIALAVV